MSGIFWLGLVIIIIGIIICIIEYRMADCIIVSAILMSIGAIFIVIGGITTASSLDKAKPGYILENSDGKQIEVLATKDNFIQFVQDNDTLVVTQSDWINNYCLNMRIVNIKNF